MCVDYMNNLYIKQFIFGGNSSFRLLNIKTGNEFEFKISVSDGNKNLFFVYYTSHTLKSSEYLGNIKLVDKNFIFDKGKKGTGDIERLPVKALVYLITNLDKLSPLVKVQHLGKCSRCGRKLTDALSVERGLGPECFKKVNY